MSCKKLRTVSAYSCLSFKTRSIDAKKKKKTEVDKITLISVVTIYEKTYTDICGFSVCTYKKYSKPLAHEHLHQGEWGTGK